MKNAAKARPARAGAVRKGRANPPPDSPLYRPPLVAERESRAAGRGARRHVDGSWCRCARDRGHRGFLSRLAKGTLDAHHEIIVLGRKGQRRIRGDTAVADQHRLQFAADFAAEDGTARSPVAGLAVERKFAGPFGALRELFPESAFLQRQMPGVAPIDMAASGEFDRAETDMIGDAVGLRPVDRRFQLDDGPIMHRIDGIRVAAAGHDRGRIDRHANLAAVGERQLEQADIGAGLSRLVEQNMRRRGDDIVGERQLAGAMRLAAGDDTRGCVAAAHIGRLQPLGRCKLRDGLAAVLAEYHHGRKLQAPRRLQPRRQEGRRSVNFAGNAETETQTSCIAHDPHFRLTPQSKEIAKDAGTAWTSPRFAGLARA